jgi:hypothetical protein
MTACAFITFIELKEWNKNLKPVQEGKFGSTWAMGMFQINIRENHFAFVVLGTL